MKSLLVELLVEELPPKALRTLGGAFAQTLGDSLKAQALAGATSVISGFATPRRLAVHITDVLAVAPDKEVMLKLMPKSVALDTQDKPTEALKKRLVKEGRAALADTWPSAAEGPDHLLIQSDGKAESMYLRSVAAGTTLLAGLKNALEESLRKLPIPKVMTYQLSDGWTDEKFVRPAHGLVALHGADVVAISVLGLAAGRVTRGHRFEAKKPAIELRGADSYVAQLESEGAVIAGFEKRRDEIARQLDAAADKEDLQCIEDAALLDEVTALVERPNVLLCQFEAEYLEVPQECLILTMKSNQKYFPLMDRQGQLTNKFLVVSNISPTDPRRVIDGNERVVRPRLADAKFFFEQDKKTPLAARAVGLDKVVYHNQLGSQGQRVERVRALARRLGTQIGGEALGSRADQAASLAKADLLTDMVGEFPELQGIMGRYYALAEGHSADIAEAIREQYLPRGAGDELPATATGMALALADKIETLAGVFAIQQKPTGARDPFGVRRAAIGLLRILIERQLPIELPGLIEQALGAQPVKLKTEMAAELYDYIVERLRAYYLEATGDLKVTTEMFDAVLANRPASPLDFDKRLRALAAFLRLDNATSLAAANKRIGNILKKAGDAIPATVRDELLREQAERDLYAALQSAEKDTAPLFAAADYQGSLSRLAGLRTTVDAFFDGVMVMAEDAALRTNRLALLSRLSQQFLRVADLSRLPG